MNELDSATGQAVNVDPLVGMPVGRWTASDITPCDSGGMVAYGDYKEKEKAVEFARYMATAAEKFMEACNDLDIVCGDDGEEHDADDICNAEQVKRDAWVDLKCSIHNFRKRDF